MKDLDKEIKGYLNFNASNVLDDMNSAFEGDKKEGKEKKGKKGNGVPEDRSLHHTRELSYSQFGGWGATGGGAAMGQGAGAISPGGSAAADPDDPEAFKNPYVGEDDTPYMAKSFEDACTAAVNQPHILMKTSQGLAIRQDKRSGLSVPPQSGWYGTSRPKLIKELRGVYLI